MDNGAHHSITDRHLLDDGLYAMFWRPTRLGPSSAWYGHIPFAFWLVVETRPSVLVELGTEWGVSYAAFCDAVENARLATRCFAVDTWRGDQHVGEYGEDVFAELNRVHEQRYAGFSTLLRMRFEDALSHFPDRSIDLLHIDGEHTYTAVSRDFASWWPKLSKRAVVLFHDINVCQSDFGVQQFWQEVRGRYPSFEFVHASGLGVLAVGAEAPAAIQSLCAMSDAGARSVRERFAVLGERWHGEVEREKLQATIAELTGRLQSEQAARLALQRAARGRFVLDPADLRISVVVPLFDGARFIEQALDSVLQQTRAADEIIVVDDGSRDLGPQIVERMASRAPITLMHKPNGGQSSARNLGIAHASGNLVALLDQDDIWYPTHLAELIKPFLEPQARRLGWVYSNLDEIDDQGRMVAYSCLRNLPYHHPKSDLLACLALDMFVLPSASLIAKDAFQSVGGFDEALSGYEDDDLFVRLFRAGFGNVFVDLPLTRWRIHPGGSSYSYRMAESRMKYLRKLLAEFPDEPARGRVFSRDCFAPRFFHLLARDYRLAVVSGSPIQIRNAAHDLAFVARLHKWKIRLVMRLLMPVIGSPALRPAIRPLMSALRPLVRAVLR